MKKIYVTMAASALAMAWSGTAWAGDTCDLNGADSGSNAADANNQASASQADALACGVKARVESPGGVAIGNGAIVDFVADNTDGI